jgi:DNA replication protein DnaC
MTVEAVNERVRENLLKLKLGRMAELLDSVAEEASQRGQTHVEFLDNLLEEEAAVRAQRTLAVKTALAHFPAMKTLASFDFSYQPSIDEKRIRTLATGRFVANGENVVFLGPPGVGKTHLAIALGLEAVARGYSVYFLTVADLVDQLVKDMEDHRLTERLRALAHPKLLILDEFGYVPIERPAATFLFQLVSRRYERGSVILTSNLSYGEWGTVLGNDILAAAILDRLLHHATTIPIKGSSYRLKEKRRAGVFRLPDA